MRPEFPSSNRLPDGLLADVLERRSDVVGQVRLDRPLINDPGSFFDTRAVRLDEPEPEPEELVGHPVP